MRRVTHHYQVSGADDPALVIVHVSNEPFDKAAIRSLQQKAAAMHVDAGRDVVPRHLRLIVRFSDAELEMVRGRAALAGLATAAWVGQAVVEVASNGWASPGLVDLCGCTLRSSLLIESLTDPTRRSQ